MTKSCEIGRVGVAIQRRCDLEAVDVHPEGRLRYTVVRRRRRATRPVEVEGVRWAIARVFSGEEFRVADDLGAVGFRTFAPHGVRVALRGRVASGDKRARVERDYPVFPGYLFVGLPAGLLLARMSHDRLIDVLSCANGRGEREVAAAVATVSDLHCAGLWDERARVAVGVRFGIGDAVRPMAGPFAGMVGRVVALPSDMRLIVEMKLFGRMAPVEMIPRQVRRV